MEMDRVLSVRRQKLLQKLYNLNITMTIVILYYYYYFLFPRSCDDVLRGSSIICRRHRIVVRLRHNNRK